jgi:hypothetical protein
LRKRGWAALLGAAALAWAPGAAAAAPTPKKQPPPPPYPSEPALAPPLLHVISNLGTSSRNGPHSAAGDIFVAPIKNYSLSEPFIGKPGPEILEPDGTVVWQDPLGRGIKVGRSYFPEVAMDFHPDHFEGQEVLVWWQGYITPQGFGNGVWKIVNRHYQVVAEIHAPRGYELDFHDLVLTPQGDAYVIGNKLVHISLRCCGGPPHSSLYDQVVFEIEPKTGKVLWSWDPLQHVRLKESYAQIYGYQTWDPYHVNSISFGPAGAPIISMRNTWAAYWINRRNGAVFARLGGKHSTFKLGPGVHFAWQHDVSQQPGERISVFDDEAAPPEGKQSRGIVIQLDWKDQTATLVNEFTLPHPALAGSQGNVEPLPNHNWFVGWGQLPYLSEYGPSRQLLYLAALPGPDESYRAYKEPWVGEPNWPPAVVARTEKSEVVVGASWNGSTQVSAWQLLAGTSPVALAPTGPPQPKTGFETTIKTTATGPYYAVEALGPGGQVLATSPAVEANGKAA